MKRIEFNLHKLKKLYETKRFTTFQLALIFDVSTRTIQRRLNEIGFDLLEDTNRDEFGRILCKGKRLKPQNSIFNGMYKHGKSSYRKKALSHFKKECFHCKSTENIIIHHIDKNRYNNALSNLRPVCRSCHLVIEHPDVLEKLRNSKKKSV